MAFLAAIPAILEGLKSIKGSQGGSQGSGDPVQDMINNLLGNQQQQQQPQQGGGLSGLSDLLGSFKGFTPGQSTAGTQGLGSSGLQSQIEQQFGGPSIQGQIGQQLGASPASPSSASFLQNLFGQGAGSQGGGSDFLSLFSK